VQNLGPVTVANGYTEAWIIYGDRTILGPGGGVCQVSTTCFRAAFWAGLPIVERSPHSYRVSWYEPPVGLDAAVFSPSVDTKFQNDADTPLLILTEVDEKNSKLYFRFYGKPSGRKVTLEGPTTSNPVKPGDPIVEQDPSLSPGARVQVETPRDGLDVTLYRIVEQDGTILSKDRFFSRYVPWPARYRVGPPKAEPTAAPQ
jgi:vancomycin resistance protein YoaR